MEFNVKQITPTRNNKKIPLDELSTIKLHLTKEQATNLLQHMQTILISDEYENWLDIVVWRKTENPDGSYKGTIIAKKR